MSKIKPIIQIGLSLIVAWFALPLLSKIPPVPNGVLSPYVTTLINDHIILGALMIIALPAVLVGAAILNKLK